MTVSTCYYPSEEQFVELSLKYNLVPVWREILADLETPVSVYTKTLMGDNSCLLESVEGTEKLSRYSFIAGNPFMILKAFGRNIEIISKTRSVSRNGNLFAMLRKIFASYRVAPIPDLPRFFGGSVGYVGYDALCSAEKSTSESSESSAYLADAVLMFPETVIVYDHFTTKLKIVINKQIEGSPVQSYHHAVEEIEQLVKSIRNNNNRFPNRPFSVDLSGERWKPCCCKSNMTRQLFMNNVDRIKQQIARGVIQQAVLSQRFEQETRTDPLLVYRSLRAINPSPYMFYLDFGTVKLAGASPEMLVRVEEGTVETRPIAGTRPRGNTEALDIKLEEELINDPKEQKEHLMLVKMGCQDLERISVKDSVQVTSFMTCERYSHVMHLVSEIKGKISRDKDALDALQSCFPAGTVTGTPRGRAMEIIDQLENTRRGVYGGVVGYISYAGNLDTCITIRTVVFINGKAYAQAGAGIVADSCADREYEETVNKVSALMEALNKTEEVIL